MKKPIGAYDFDDDGWIWEIKWDPNRRPPQWTVVDEFWRQKKIHENKMKVKGKPRNDKPSF